MMGSTSSKFSSFKLEKKSILTFITTEIEYSIDGFEYIGSLENTVNELGEAIRCINLKRYLLKRENRILSCSEKVGNVSIQKMILLNLNIINHDCFDSFN